jgi:hypothetical protein
MFKTSTMPPNQASLKDWLVYVFDKRVGWLAASSLFINIGLIVPALFGMLVYDKVVHNGIFETLWALAIGVVLFLAAEITVRALRARDLERVALAIDETIDRRLLASLLQPSSRSAMQPGMAARFLTLYRDLASARDFFSSQYLVASRRSARADSASDLCRHNAAVALASGRADLWRVWMMAACATAAQEPRRIAAGGVAFGFASPGLTALVHQRLRQRDVQTVALLSCLTTHSRAPRTPLLPREDEEGRPAPLRIGSYVVPPGHFVFASPAVSMNLPYDGKNGTFRRPDSFEPDRFGEERDEASAQYSYSAFGGGLHACLGEQFGFLQVKTIVSVLLRTFELRLVGGMPDL